MNSIYNENGIIAAIYKVQHGFGGVAPPHLYIGLQGEKHVGQESLVDVGPLELGYPEGRPGWARAKHWA